jgi:hypothetical protein
MGAGAVPRVVVAAGLLLVLVTPAAGAPRQAPTLRIDRVDLTAKWREGWLTGAVEFAGNVSAPSALTAFVRPADHPSRITARMDYAVGAGPFTETLKLPARPLPGTYVLRVFGTSGTSLLPKVDTNVTLAPPAEGIVDRAYVSLTPTGPPIRVVQGPRKRLFAHFHFLVPPEAPAVTVDWRTPTYRFVGAKTYRYTPRIDSFVRSTRTPLDRGIWYAILHVGSTIAKRVSVRIT